MPRVLVTGAAGFIAFHLIEHLLRAGFSVVGLDNFDRFYSRDQKEENLEDLRRISLLAAAPFVFLEQDIRSIDHARLAEYEIDCLIHLAAKAGVRPSLSNSLEYFDTNLNGTICLLELCRNLGIKKFIFGSSSSVYGSSTQPPFREGESADRPVSPYAASKRAGELVCAAYAHLYGMQVAGLRFFTVFGPRQRPDLAIHKFAKKILAGEAIPVFGDGSSGRDYTYCTDIANGIVRAFAWLQTSPAGTFEVFNLGGAKVVELNFLIRALETRLGIRAIKDYRPAQLGDMEITSADISKSGRLLGYHPSVSFESGIDLFATWLLSRPPGYLSRAG